MTATSKAEIDKPRLLSVDILSNLLFEAAAAVDEPSQEQARLIKMLRELRLRLAGQELRIAVLGQFKRGKSSLLNALLGIRALPKGIIP
jgi:tRNA U34 5-carboxymethylaminomethyl modifying GTPase MnmE/TrmE